MGLTAPPQRIGVYGGAFDPPHAAHLAVARAAIEQLALDELLVIPTGDAWHKSRPLSPARDRLALCRLAFADWPRVRVDDRELQRDGPTYTIDTLRDLRTQHPEAELFFITGADALAQILSWKDAEELFELAQFIGVTRPGYVLTEDGLPADRVHLQEVPAMAISSTDCRDRVGDGEPVWYLVPDGVVQYINKHQLYAVEESRASH